MAKDCFITLLKRVSMEAWVAGAGRGDAPRGAGGKEGGRGARPDAGGPGRGCSGGGLAHPSRRFRAGPGQAAGPKIVSQRNFGHPEG